MQSVSDNIMLGQLCPIGTGSFTLLLDERRLADAVVVSAGFMYGDADIEGRGGLTPGSRCRCPSPSLDESAHGGARLSLPSVARCCGEECRAFHRSDTICDARPCLTVADVLSWCHVTVLQQRHFLADGERDIFSVGNVAWLLTDESWLFPNEPRLLPDKPRLLSH